MSLELPPLPYSYDALEPYIDEETMRLHHDKHHQAYVDKLDDAINKHPELADMSAEDLLKNFAVLPEDISTVVRNQGGGHVNHSMFWQIMQPNGGGKPEGALAQAINEAFNSFEDFQTRFNEAGAKVFGSGWVWLVRNSEGGLQITATANQDNPLSQGFYPIMGNDVWEHAYYLKYQNRRPEYLKAWWNVVNWEEAERRFGQ